MKPINALLTRRGALRGGLALGALAFFSPGVFAQELARTPRLTEGPFYPDRLPLDTERAVQSHLDACPACTRAATAERALTELLDRELPQHPASLALKRRLAAQWPATEPRRRLSWPRWAWSLGPALAAAVLLVVFVATPPCHRGGFVTLCG